LRDLRRITGNKKFVFPSIRTFEKCMSENTINAALRGMGYSKEVMTAHGFRATARPIMDEILDDRTPIGLTSTSCEQARKSFHTAGHNQGRNDDR